MESRLTKEDLDVVKWRYTRRWIPQHRKIQCRLTIRKNVLLRRIRELGISFRLRAYAIISVNHPYQHDFLQTQAGR